MPYPIDNYKDKAAKTFPNLVKTFSTWGNSWQIGNVFDTLTDYLLRFPDAEKTIPTTVAETALGRWTNAAGSMCWYDDYGWWGIASEKAFHTEYANIFADYAPTFQGIAKECWDIMNNGKPGKAYNYRGGPNVWDNRENGSHYGLLYLARNLGCPPVRGRRLAIRYVERGQAQGPGMYAE